MTYRYRIVSQWRILKHLRVVKVDDHRSLSNLSTSCDEHIALAEVSMQHSTLERSPMPCIGIETRQ